MIGLSPNSTRGFGLDRVRGRNLVPNPPLKIKAFIFGLLLKYLFFNRNFRDWWEFVGQENLVHVSKQSNLEIGCYLFKTRHNNSGKNIHQSYSSKPLWPSPATVEKTSPTDHCPTATDLPLPGPKIYFCGVIGGISNFDRQLSLSVMDISEILSASVLW